MEMLSYHEPISGIIRITVSLKKKKDWGHSFKRAALIGYTLTTFLIGSINASTVHLTNRIVIIMRKPTFVNELRPRAAINAPPVAVTYAIPICLEKQQQSYNEWMFLYVLIKDIKNI